MVVFRRSRNFLYDRCGEVVSNRDKNAVSSQSEELVAIREKWYSAGVRV